MGLPEFVTGRIPFFLSIKVVIPGINFSVKGSHEVRFSSFVVVVGSGGVIPELLKFELLEVIIELPTFL